MNTKFIIRFISMGLVIAMIVPLMYGCSLFDSSNKDEADLYVYFGVTDDSVECAVIVDAAIVENTAVVQDGVIYIDIDTVNNYINKKLYYDDNEGVVLYTDPTSTAVYNIGDDLYTDGDGVQNTLDYTPYISVGDTLYLAVEFVQIFSSMKYEEYDSPHRIVITTANAGDKYADVSSKDAVIRTGDSNQYEILSSPGEGSEVEVVDEGTLYTQVKTEDGIIGYILTEDIVIKEESDSKVTFSEPVYTSLTRDEEIIMVWNQVSGKAGNANINSLLANVSGVNVVSPTWFTFADADGGLTSYATHDYVTYVHGKGMEVWALADDFTKDSDGNRYVYSVLPYTSKRQAFIKSLVSTVIEYDIDGINIDYEYIGLDIADDYLQFLRELSVECRANGIVLSVDNYVPSAWSGYYDREQQAEIADYVIVMSYDEHNVDSDTAGSVASISYVTDAVAQTVEETGDASKVINGVPFYTRVWIETPEEYAEDEATIIEDSVNGNYALTSKAVTMSAAIELYETAGASPAWNEECGQYYVSWQENNSTYMIWLEDKESIELKMELVGEYGLGGAAFWKLGMESSDVWSIIE